LVLKPKLKSSKIKWPPFKEALFQILYGKGVNQLGELIDLAVQQEIIQKAGAWYSYQGNKIGQGKNNVIRYLEENTAIAQEIERMIREQLLTTSNAPVSQDDEEPAEF
jgi:recombination protein RecA